MLSVPRGDVDAACLRTRDVAVYVDAALVQAAAANVGIAEREMEARDGGAVHEIGDKEAFF